MLTNRADNLTKWLIFLGAISFLPTLFFYLVGEEGIYTITSMEMWHQNNWVQQIMYGSDNNRPPLVNWLIMPVANLIGWQHIAIAARSVSVAATLGMVGWLYWLSRKLFDDKSFALFAALAGLSLADWLLYRGWLTYTDPVFAFFTFGAMAALWGAVIEQHKGWLLASVLLASCAMLSKAFTVYIFYGTVVLVLLWQRPARKFLLSPSTLLVFALALTVPFAWFATLPQVGGRSSSMLDEIIRKLTAINTPGYFTQLAIFPFESAFRLSPAVLLAVYLLLRKRVTQPEAAPLHFNAVLLITGLSFLPYWLSPQSSIRYLLPIYPFIALVSARIIWRAGDAAKTLALRWFAGIIAFKFVFGLLLVPYYQSHFRGENYVRTAQEIMRLTVGYPLYVIDSRSVGLSIVGQIDVERWPQAPLVRPPAHWEEGFVLAPDANEVLGAVAKIYTVAGDQTFLLCRGAACKAIPAK
ncbi:MAG: glycosyltransferase family 39 protein [Gallionella sp.]|nr:glycosyltransferase family 39 protein [Gallionella sp.]